ncbi:MAG: hypothetical protein ABIN91_10455 [Mucilaginibacter sp.]|uniref:hypothetical protein n=1 Tax=Mucilaginibacter sp. TaxID=1882438 RepID=UPI0032672E5B
MKKLILSIVLCAICCAVFAQQKKFKQLKYYTGGGKPGMLDYGVFNITKPRALTGIITINLSDSTITILDNGTVKNKLKIFLVDPEEITNPDGSRVLTIETTNEKYGFNVTVYIIRDQENTAKKEMRVITKYEGSSSDEYPCVYLENLFEN